MGVFPHFFGGSILTHLEHVAQPWTVVADPHGAIASKIVKIGVNLFHHHGAVQTTPAMAQPPHPSPAVYTVQPPIQSQPLYGQGSYAYGQLGYYPEPFSSYGGTPWGYSTPSQAYYPQPLPTYSAPAATPSSGDRTWEDLTGLALTALPLLL